MTSPIAKLKIGLSDPRRIVSKFYGFFDTTIRGNHGVGIPEAEWDTLLVLDACRYDTFKHINSAPGNLQPVRSLGSKTSEFLTKNFGDEEFPDIVYVSANPNTENIGAKFHARVRLWEEVWNDELGVVPPDAVADAAIRAGEEYPNKRIIVHFMQPHIPFIGERGRELLERDDVENLNHGVKFWKQMGSSRELQQLFKEAYRENLELVLPHVRRISDHMDGLTVVTSDHGNEFGWAGVYGHPGGFYTPGLRIIPWLEMPYENRRSITGGKATAGPRKTEEVTDRLADLGYI